MKFSCCVIFAVLSVAALFVSSFIDFGRNQAVAGQRLVSDEPYGDYLASFRKPAADRNESERAMFKKLAGCKVPTPEAARKIAFGYKLKSLGGQRADESDHVVGLVPLARNVPGFGEKGDFVWIVRYGYRDPANLALEGVSEEIWVSATSGVPLAMLGTPPLFTPR